MTLFLTSTIYEFLYKNLVRRFGIFNSNTGLPLINFYDIIFSKTVAKEINISLKSNLPTKPVENGSFINDSRINEPTTIAFTVFIKAYEFELGNIIDSLEKAKSGVDLYNVVVPSKTYINMALKSFEYSYNSTKNFLQIPLEFQEVIIVKPQYATIENPKNTNNITTKNSGKSQTEKVKESKKESIIFKMTGGLFKK